MKIDKTQSYDSTSMAISARSIGFLFGEFHEGQVETHVVLSKKKKLSIYDLLSTLFNVIKTVLEIYPRMPNSNIMLINDLIKAIEPWVKSLSQTLAGKINSNIDLDGLLKETDVLCPQSVRGDH